MPSRVAPAGSEGTATAAVPAGRRALPWIGFGILLALFIGLRLYHAGMPLVDNSDWRQTDTASEAWFFHKLGLGLLPQLFYNGPGPNYVQLEMPFMPWTVAILAHFLPFGSWLLHGVAVGFSTCGFVCFWLFCRRRFGDGIAVAAATVFAVEPLGIFFGRAFQPEPAMMAGIMASLWLTQRWADRGGTGAFLLAVAAFTFAVLAKLPAATVAPAVFFIALARSRWNRIEPWALVVVPAIAAGAYTVYGGLHVKPGYDFITLILSMLRQSTYHVGDASQSVFWYRYFLESSIAWVGVVPFAVGLASRPLRASGWFWAWGGALALWCLVVVRHIRFDYYLMPLLPWIALAEGVGLWAILRLLTRRHALQGAILGAVALGTVVGALPPLKHLYTLYLPDYRLGVALRRELAPGTTIILGTENPPILFYSRHHGWRTNQLTMTELQQWLAEGAAYYIPFGSLSLPSVETYVQAHFTREMVDGTVYYDLRAPVAKTPSR